MIDNVKLQAVINAYIIFKEKNADTWIKECENANDLNNAIKIAALARNNENQKHSHQHRIKDSILQSFYNNLLKHTEKIRQINDFEDLYLLVSKCKINGIGDLTIYDTVHRLGHHLKIYPKKVYLHSGTRIGIEYLTGSIKKYFITKEELPEIFKKNNLSEEDLEDLFCIYKNQIQKCIR